MDLPWQVRDLTDRLERERERLRLLPEGRADADTEFAWVDGVAFVNAAKHEAVVAERCRERDEALAAIRRFLALNRHRTASDFDAPVAWEFEQAVDALAAMGDS